MQYDLNLTANGGQRIDAGGNFFKYRTGVGKIRVTTHKGEYIDLLPGQGAYGLEFNSLTVKDMSGNANPGQLVAGGFDFRDDNIFGTVTTIDTNDRDLVMLGRSYMWGGWFGADGNAKFNQCGIYNPAGSGVNVVVEGMRFMSDSNTGALGCTLVGGVYVPSSNIVSANNKKIGGAQSTAKVFTEQMASSNHTVGMAWLMNWRLQQFAYTPFNPARPIIIPPGQTLLFAMSVFGSNGFAEFEFYETGV